MGKYSITVVHGCTLILQQKDGSIIKTCTVKSTVVVPSKIIYTIGGVKPGY